MHQSFCANKFKRLANRLVRTGIQPVNVPRSFGNIDGLLFGRRFFGILGVPVLADNIAGAGEPFFIAPKLLQGFGRIMFDAIADGIAERF